MKTEMQFDKSEWKMEKVNRKKSKQISVRFLFMHIYLKSYDTLYAVFYIQYHNIISRSLRVPEP